ncbi:lysine--tRNA ligase, partial [Nanoarchaeota archaeon]
MALDEGNKLIKDRLEKLKLLREMGVEPYPYSFDVDTKAAEILAKHSGLAAEKKTDDKVVVAGRVMQFRNMGKASFMHIQDATGKLQIYIRKDDVGDDAYKVLKKTDLGDIIGVKGHVFATKTGEVSVYAEGYEMLCKTVRPLPEKYHGLQDKELRYRKRYLDLIMNPDVKDVFAKRSLVLRHIREYFYGLDFMEVETPSLQTIYGGANAKPFETHINAWDMKMYLSVSPELYLKRLLVGGYHKVFTICKNFRNEGVDAFHNPEFTMLEFYQAYIDYEKVMKIFEEMVEHLCMKLYNNTKVKRMFKGDEIELDFKAPWKRQTMEEALKEHADVEVEGLDLEGLQTLMNNYNVEYEGELTKGTAIQLLFEDLVEDKLLQPVHIIDHPKESTPLCKLKRGNEEKIERFESYVLGGELCNAYSELNDPLLQRELLEKQAEELRGGVEEAHPMDEDFVQAIEYGMPPAGGLGFGVDRLAIVLLGVDSIREVILFPTMKPTMDEMTVEDQDDSLKEDIVESLAAPVVKKKPISKDFGTVRLYEEDAYQKEFDSKVVEIDGNKVVLEESCFFIQGGGQAGDSGKLNNEKVIVTQKNKKKHVHLMAQKPTFKVGDTVHGVVDWDRRHAIMKLHSAAHIVEHFLFKEFGELKSMKTFVDDKKDQSQYKVGDIDLSKIKDVEIAANKFISG